MSKHRMRPWLAAGLAVGVAIGAAAATTVSASAAASVDRVSVSSEEVEADEPSGSAVLSADGRYVAFTSLATNLSPQDSDAVRQEVYLRDRVDGTTELVSVGTAGTGSGGVIDDISADGRYVVFTSHGTDLVAGDFNGVGDVFIRDRVAGTTEVVSVDGDESQAAQRSFDGSVSRDGRYVAFTSYAPLSDADRDSDSQDVYVRDRVEGTTTLVSVTRKGVEAGGQRPSISDNGRFVSYTSRNKTVVKGDKNGKHDVFVRDVATGRSERVSVSSKGDEAVRRSFESQIAGFGRYVVFTSAAGNLVKKDTNKKLDVFVHDRRKDKTELVSVDSGERQAGGPVITPSISADGRYVSFMASSDLREGGRTMDALYLRDRADGGTSLLMTKVGPGPVLSGNGKVLAFNAFRSNVVRGDTNGVRDVFAFTR